MMEISANAGPAGWTDTLAVSSGGYVPHRAAVLVRKVARIAISLLSIRILSVGGLLIALWLCPVETFANLGMYLAAVNLAALAVFGRYELLVIAADGERKCADAFHLCILTGAFAIVVTLAVAITVQHMFVTYVTLSFTGALFSRAWLRLGLTLATRYGRYQRAVKALVPHAIAQPVILVYLIYKGHNPFLAFVLSDLFGQLIAAGCVCWSERHSFRAMLERPLRLRAVSALASLNLGLPTLNLTAAASAFLFATAPLFYLPSVPNGILAGTLGLLFRLLELPTNLASASLGPVLLKEIADRNRHGMMWASRAAFLLPAAIAIVVFGLISLGGLTLNTLELASSWHMALTILPVVALFQAGITAALPLIDIATLAGRQKGLFTLNIVAVALAGAALLLWRGDPIFAILIAGSIGFARVLVMSVWLAGSGVTVPAK
jgi:hypothetical protein